jgi:hypothetical protein
MKLATLKDGTRDGLLAVVARDLKTAHVMGGTPDDAHQRIRLPMLVNDVPLQNLLPARPATGFSPRGRNPQRTGRGMARRQSAPGSRHEMERTPGRSAADGAMAFNFAQLIAHLARTCNGGPAASSARDRGEYRPVLLVCVHFEMADEKGKSVGAIEQKIKRPGQ